MISCSVNQMGHSLTYQFVCSPWVTVDKLQDWYLTAKSQYHEFKANYNKSRQQEFTFVAASECFKDCVENFAAGALGMQFLAGAALSHSNEAIKFIDAEIGSGVQVVDGFDVIHPTMLTTHKTEIRRAHV